MAHLSPLDQASVRLCIASVLLLAIAVLMHFVEIESNGTGVYFALALGMLALAVIALIVALHQLWRVTKITLRWVDDRIIEYQIARHPT